MNANEFVKILQDECERFKNCSDGCPFYTDDYDKNCCNFTNVTGCAPYQIKDVKENE